MKKGTAIKKISRLVFIFSWLSLSPAMAADVQTVSLIPASLSGASGEPLRIGIMYDNATTKATGIGIRIHFDSRFFSTATFEDLYGESLVTSDGTPRDDVSDFDGDPATDKYLAVAWMDVGGGWPGFVNPPMTLGKVLVQIKPHTGNAVTRLNVTTSGTAAGHRFHGKGAIISIP
jgi:hypothetical protein